MRKGLLAPAAAPERPSLLRHCPSLECVTVDGVTLPNNASTSPRYRLSVNLDCPCGGTAVDSRFHPILPSNAKRTDVLRLGASTFRLQFDDPAAHRDGKCLRPVFGSEFVQNVSDMDFHRLF